MQLVELLDGLLPQLETDETYAHFQLDGQMAVVDDYLEIRPTERARLGRLNQSGRLSMGPWYTLPDEFLVSGETLIRNLSLGIAKAAEFGGHMHVGYLPDMFGHIAQMPQILAGFGFGDAVVWRGVPRAIESSGFWWQAPDGTRVRAEYLADGYGNGARVPESGGGLMTQIDSFIDAQGQRAGSPLLWMNGTDHLLPQPHLGRVVAEVNDADCGYHVKVTSLTEHLQDVPRGDLALWKGELRSGARSNLLMGVASARVDVKQAAALAERSLERVAEPLATCWQPPESYPHEFFESAWLEVIRNAAHDSICGCSTDEVNDAVLHRYSEATRVAEAITERSLIRVIATSGQDAVALNPTSRPRSGMLSAIIAGEVAPPNTQQVTLRAARERTDTIDRATAVAVVQRAVVDDPRVSRAELQELDDGTVIATIHSDRQPKQTNLNELRETLERLANENPTGVVHLEVQRLHPTQEILLRSEQVPGFGWRGLAPAELGSNAVRLAGQGLSNGLVRVEADQSNGTFAINGVKGFGRILDEGDCGDTYNWSPPTQDLLVDHPFDVEVSVVESGPVRGRIRITRHYRWPSHVDNGARVGSREVTLETFVEIRAGEDLVRVKVTFDNQCRDHRVRFVLPLVEPADKSVAECAFTTVERQLTAEGGPNEFGLPTFPSRRFITAGGVLVVHDGLNEYELLDIDDTANTGVSKPLARSLALTLVRSVGLISSGPMAMRPLPAGPPTPTPDAQMIGPRVGELVIHLGERDPYEVADEAFTPLLSGRYPAGSGLGDPATHGCALEVHGAEVSALRRRIDGRVELRLFNTSSAPSLAEVPNRTGAFTNLNGDETGEAFNGQVTLGPHQIVTIALD